MTSSPWLAATSPRSRTLAPGIVVVDDLLSHAECEEWRSLADAVGWQDAPITTGGGFVMRKDVRNNDRVIVDDADRAAFLWSRLQPFAFDVAGRSPTGLNERLRFYRYGPGQKFDWHYDGCYETPDGRSRSWVTFMVYLNDGAVGGETRIQVANDGDALARLFESGVDPIVDIVPRTGMGLMFLHQLRHTGAEVRQGSKYVVRSDVMYSMIAASSSRRCCCVDRGRLGDRGRSPPGAQRGGFPDGAAAATTRACVTPSCSRPRSRKPPPTPSSSATG